MSEHNEQHSDQLAESDSTPKEQAEDMMVESGLESESQSERCKKKDASNKEQAKGVEVQQEHCEYKQPRTIQGSHHVVKLNYGTVIGTVYDNVVERVRSISVDEPLKRRCQLGQDTSPLALSGTTLMIVGTPTSWLTCSLRSVLMNKNRPRGGCFIICVHISTCGGRLHLRHGLTQRSRDLGKHICYNKQMRRVTYTLMRLHSPMVDITLGR
jgi:hypothetical protein